MVASKIIVALAAACLVSTAAYADRSGSPLHKGKTAGSQAAIKVKNEAFVTGNGNSTPLTQYSYTPIDSGTVFKCKDTCIISADVTSQMITGGADWAICIVVDGEDIECQYQGVQSGPSGYVMGNSGANASLAAGNHTIQTQLYTESTTASYQYFAMHYAVHQ